MDENEQRVYRTLRAYGAPLSNAFGPGESGSFAEMLPQILAMARRHPVVGRVMPVVLFKNADVDFLALAKSLNVDERRTLGFLMELTYEVSGDDLWRTRADALREYAKPNEREYFFDTPETSLRRFLTGLRTPEVAKSWGYAMMSELEHFKSCLNVYQTDENDEGEDRRAASVIRRRTDWRTSAFVGQVRRSRVDR